MAAAGLATVMSSGGRTTLYLAASRLTVETHEENPE
jgi:hypothetical protein